MIAPATWSFGVNPSSSASVFALLERCPRRVRRRGVVEHHGRGRFGELERARCLPEPNDRARTARGSARWPAHRRSGRFVHCERHSGTERSAHVDDPRADWRGRRPVESDSHIESGGMRRARGGSRADGFAGARPGGCFGEHRTRSAGSARESRHDAGATEKSRTKPRTRKRPQSRARARTRSLLRWVGEKSGHASRSWRCSIRRVSAVRRSGRSSRRA